MKTILNSTVRLFAVLTLMALTIFAQSETGQISGTVLDPSGAIVPNAAVSVKNTGTGATRNVTTTSAGVYVVTNLPPAVYQVKVDAAGFSSTVTTVTVNAGARVGADVNLQIGRTGETVMVSESAAMVNTESQTIGAVIDSRQVAELPTFSRDPYSLIGTLGNVSDADPSGRGAGYAINGQRSAGTNVMLDGTANNNEFTASRGQKIPLDSMQELSVLTNNFTAEYGRASAGVVNAVIRSGTNAFHGSAFEQGRYSALASNSFDNNANGIPKQVFTRNSFGYLIGGPAIKNKLFFMNATEWTKVRSQSVKTVYVPTPELIAASAANTQNFFKTFGGLRSGLVNLGTFTKAQLTSRGFDPCKGLAATSKCALLPSSTPLFSRVSYGFPADSGGGSPQNTYNTVAKVDYNLSEKTQMYLSYVLYREKDFEGNVSNSPYRGYDSANQDSNNTVIYSLTHSFSPRFISQSKVDFNRFFNVQPFNSTYGPVPTLYLGSAASATSILGNNVALPGYNPYTPGNGIPFGGPQNFIQIYQDFSYIKGRHNFRFGGSYNYIRDNRTFGAYQTSVNVLGTTAPKGIDNMLNGLENQIQTAVYPQGKFPCGATVTPACTLTLPVGQPNFSRSNRYHDWGFYAQDSWKINPRLTLTAGLRWDAFGTQHNKDPKLDSNFYLGSGSTVYDQIAAGSLQLAPNSPIGKLWNTPKGNFQPRIGMAYDVFGDGKTSFRGGYGLYFERNFGNVTFNVIQNPPNYAVLSLFAGVDVPSIPISTDNIGPLGGSSGSKALGKVSLRAVNPDIKNAYVQSISAAIEHKFGQSVVGAVEYNGSYGDNQYGIANINKAGSDTFYRGTACTPGKEGDFGGCGGRLVGTQYSNINFRTNGGFSRYNAMNVRLDVHDLARTGIELRSNYTWSHAIDTLSDTFSSSGNQANLGWLDPFHPEIDKGDAYYDLRHRFTVAMTYRIPVKSSNSFAKHVLGGWAASPVFLANTGAPFSLYDCTNAAAVCPYAFFTAKASKTGTPVATETPNIYKYIDFAKSTNSDYYNKKIGVSDYGPFPSNMIGRNFFRSPGSYNLDMALSKAFTFKESKRLIFRGEAFNMLNHANLSANTGDNDVSSVDYVSASRNGRRQFQLLLKLEF